MRKVNEISNETLICLMKNSLSWNDATKKGIIANARWLRTEISKRNLLEYTNHFSQDHHIKHKQFKCNCIICGAEMIHKPSKKHPTKSYCSQACANRQEGRKHGLPKITEDGITNKRRKNGQLIRYKYKCAWDGQTPVRYIENTCRKNVGHMARKANYIKLGFDESKIGTPEVWQELERIKNKIQSEYDSGKSLNDLNFIYNFPDECTLGQFLQKMGIKTRTIRESTSLAYLQGKMNHAKPCQGYHSDWQGGQHYYRSSFELDYYRILDEQKVSYETETLSIKYFNSVKNKECTAIPDIYIPSENLIVEIKSIMTLDVQVMKDRRDSFLKQGYNFRLILDKKEQNLDEAKQYENAYCRQRR